MTHAKYQIHTEVYFWDVFNPFGHARPHPLEILGQICNISMDPWSHVKKTFKVQLILEMKLTHYLA